MKRTQPGKILRSSLLELYVVANNADNVRLLPHRFFKIAEGGHEYAFTIVRESPSTCYL
jgi:hypothetical protein